MKARLYKGSTLVGTLELSGRQSYSIRVRYSVSGEILELGSGLERAVVPPTSIVEVYHRRMTHDFASKQTRIDYVLAKTIVPDDERPRRTRRRSSSS